MNKIIISGILTLSIFFCSCNEDVIDLLPIGDTEAIFFQNEEQMDMAAMGMYQKICWYYIQRGGPNNNITQVMLLPSDDLTIPAANAFENFVQLNGSQARSGEYYQFTYQLIARANVMLKKIEENGDFAYQSKPDQKNWNKGEALFFRAFGHWNLWNVFGTAPKVTEVLNLDNCYLPNTTGTELLDQAINDLEEAVKLLPAGWDSKFLGRLTKNTALGLRGKALMFRGTVNKSNADFTAALADFNAIQGRSLTANYGDNFEPQTENNVESLFEYQASDQMVLINVWLDNDDFPVIGDISHYIGYYIHLPTTITSQNLYYRATVPLQNAYEDDDPRKAYNINPDAATNRSNVLKYTHNYVLCVPPFGPGQGIITTNPRILRYADVLLLKAEALVRSGGNLSDAIGLINQIRERARNSTVDGTPSAIPADRDVSETDRSTVLEWVFQERRLELFAEEGHRWWDLRRRHIAGEIDLKTLDFGSLNANCKFEDKNIYFALPEREVVDNPNLKQNDGY